MTAFAAEKVPLEPGETVTACVHVIQTGKFWVIYGPNELTPYKTVLCAKCEEQRDGELDVADVVVEWAKPLKTGN